MPQYGARRMFAIMPSFDVVSKVDGQNLDNAINSAIREIESRYDFRGSDTSIVLDKKKMTVHVETEDAMKVQSIVDVLMMRLSKAGIDPRCLELDKDEYAAGSRVKKDMTVKQGLDKDVARNVIKAIKDSKLKVEPVGMDDQVRVSAKKIDDLQGVISALRAKDFGLPLQFINLK